MIPDQNKEKPLSPKAEKSRGKAQSYGGYSTRFEYERTQRRQNGLWRALVMCLAVLLLGATVLLGILSLYRSRLLGNDGNVTGEGNNAIRVPTYSEMAANQKSPEEIVREVTSSLVTVEAEFADGSCRRGTGFLIDQDGTAVCATSLLQAPGSPLFRVTVYTASGTGSVVDLPGRYEPLGIQLLRLHQDGVYTPVPVEDDDGVERGETLYVLGAVSQNLYYGTALSGMAASVGQPVLVGEGETAKSVPMIYMEVTPNSSLWGAPVVNEGGKTVGFCTDAVLPDWNGLVSVIPISQVYSVAGEILNTR